jgi:hypothetical protein
MPLDRPLCTVIIWRKAVLWGVFFSVTRLDVHKRFILFFLFYSISIAHFTTTWSNDALGRVTQEKMYNLGHL